MKLTILALAMTLAASTASATCTVTDGDTIRCGDERIRLQGIDAPEMKERGGTEAKRMAEHLVYDATSIGIVRTGVDRYGRTTGYVILNNSSDLGASLIAAGVVNRCARYDRQGRYAAMSINSGLPRKGYCRG